MDSVNPVANPWGSVNSCIFDALAAGALVISNEALGLHELFGEALEEAKLPLPVYTSGNNLADTIDYYLRNDDVRMRLVEVMRAVVVNKHSYSMRAIQLQEILNQSFGMNLLTKENLTATRR